MSNLSVNGPRGMLSLLLLSFALLTACVYVPTKGKHGESSMDQETLTFWYNQLIMPPYVAYEKETATLETIARSYANSTIGSSKEATTLAQLKSQYARSILTLQDLAIYDLPFFQGKTVTLYESAATSAVNVAHLKTYIHANLTADELYRRLEQRRYVYHGAGYTAIDYILYSGDIPLTEESKRYVATVSEVLHRYASEAREQIESKKLRYPANNSFSPTSSLSLTLNHMMDDVEKSIRNIKIGVPAGLRPNRSDRMPPAPLSTEAHYHAQLLSTQLLQRSLKALVRFMDGQPYQLSQPPIKDFGFRGFLLRYIENTEIRDQVIPELSKSCYRASVQSDALNQDIAALVVGSQAERQQIEDIYSTLQAIIGPVKAKIMPALHLRITYGDSDEGD